MKLQRLGAIALLLCIIPVNSIAGGRGGGGGWDFHGDSATRSASGPNGANHSTTVTNTGNGYHRSSTTSADGYNRSSNGGYNTSTGNFNHNSSASGPNGSRSSSTNGNTNSGNYYHQGSGNANGYGSYSNSGTGNYYNHTYSGSGTATNAYGQTYHTSTYANNGYAYHGAYVNTPYYHGYPAYGWNGGVVWAPAPIYWGGGFWGPFAVGAVTAAAYGAIYANNVTYTSYQIQQSSPGAKLLAAYHLTQTPCGPPGLIVMYGPNNSVICAKPNGTVAAGSYTINEQTLTIANKTS
jgi:hypothetical protein